MLQDSFGRVHDYLRISLTDNCNFRCTYCMPQEEMKWMPSAKLMTADEIFQMAEIFVSLGVKKIRLTGGEPLVRKDFDLILAHLAMLPIELTLTTNGILLDRHLDNLKSAGVKSINISLDSLDREVFKNLTKRDQFVHVWDNILLMLNHGFRIKINAVALHGIIEKEVLAFIQVTQKLPLHVRFIEFMPFAGNHWTSQQVVTASELLQIVTKHHQVLKLEDKPHATAKKYKIEGYEGTFAFITTMSQHFCGDCNRMRLTADGKMKNCLFGKEEMDLLGTIRSGESILPLIQTSLSRKHAALGGQFSSDYRQADPDKIQNRSMINIGG